MSTFKPGQKVRAIRDTASLYGAEVSAGEVFTVDGPARHEPGGFLGHGGVPVLWRALRRADFEAVEPAPLDTIKIKPGQVWAATADPEETYRVIEVRDGDVWSENRYGGHVVLSASFFPNGRQLVTDATPAPLDPSKVKVGDPVAVRVDDEAIGSFEVRGEVRGHLGGAWSVGPWNVASNGTWHEGVTLTDHQPAPEPETEWRPGTVAVIEVFGDTQLRALSGGTRGEWHTESGDTYREPEEVADVRPLVVIDPADVNLDGVAAAIANEMGLLPEEVEPMHREAAVGALRALGIGAS